MKYVLIAGVVILACFIIILQFIPIGIEPLTEVYLENHATLPSGALVNKSYNYTFTVHNLEYRNMSYGYEVVIEYANKSYNLTDVSVERGNFELIDNESISIESNYFFDRPFNRAKIKTIVYKDNNETIDIHFWINEVIPFKIQIINGTLNMSEVVTRNSSKTLNLSLNTLSNLTIINNTNTTKANITSNFTINYSSNLIKNIFNNFSLNKS